MCNDPIGLRLHEIPGLTYRQMWEVYVEPNLRMQDDLAKAAGKPVAGGKPKGSFDPAKASTAEFDRFLGDFCKGRKYTGKKWWLGEGATIYDGKGDR